MARATRTGGRWRADNEFELDNGVRAQFDLLGMLGTIVAGEADLLPSGAETRLGREGWIFGQDPATEKPLP